MPKRKYRQRQESDEEENEDTNSLEKVREAKERQKYRKKPGGVSAVGLALGKKLTDEEEKLTADPFKLKTGGGLVTLQDLSDSRAEGKLDEEEDEVLKRLTNTFSAETNRRDDDDRMMTYIEEEVSKRKGVQERTRKLSTYEEKVKSLYKLPEHLQVEEKKSTEEMLSNQMLSGIPEVKLGVKARIRNIEETELAKIKLLKEMTEKKKEKTSFAVTNYAANYTHHSLRFFKDGGALKAEIEAEKEKKEEAPVYIPVVGESEPELKYIGPKGGSKDKGDQKQTATDDAHFEKYKKKFKM